MNFWTLGFVCTRLHEQLLVIRFVTWFEKVRDHMLECSCKEQIEITVVISILVIRD